jgi:hypothetical protein
MIDELSLQLSAYARSDPFWDKGSGLDALAAIVLARRLLMLVAFDGLTLSLLNLLRIDGHL